MDWWRNDFPRRPVTGLTSIYCRKCGREIARTPQAQFRTVSKCAICALQEEGVKNPEDYVLQQYIQSDPMKPPVPRNAEDANYVFDVFPEDKPREGEPLKPTGIAGTVFAVFRAFGFAKDVGKEQEKAVPKSKQAAQRRKRESIFD